MHLFCLFSLKKTMQVFLIGFDILNNCSGHRIGTAEVESALVSHPKCAEAAVVGVEHEVRA
jgi:hypothetical protein